MKNKLILAAIFAASACALFAGLLIVTAAGTMRKRDHYPLAGTVTEIDAGADIVTFEDAAGNEWSFYGIEDWMIGDGVAAIMDDNGTETVTDDVIVSVRYAG